MVTHFISLQVFVIVSKIIYAFFWFYIFYIAAVGILYCLLHILVSFLIVWLDLDFPIVKIILYSNPLLLSLQKRAGFQGYQSNMPSQVSIRPDTPSCIMAGQDNPIGGKESQEQAKKHWLPLLGVPQSTRLTAIAVAYTQRTWCWPKRAPCLPLQSLWAHLSFV